MSPSPVSTQATSPMSALAAAAYALAEGEPADSPWLCEQWSQISVTKAMTRASAPRWRSYVLELQFAEGQLGILDCYLQPRKNWALTHAVVRDCPLTEWRRLLNYGFRDREMTNVCVHEAIAQLRTGLDRWHDGHAPMTKGSEWPAFVPLVRFVLSRLPPE